MRMLIATVTAGGGHVAAAAAKANRVEDLPYRIEQLLGSKKLADLAKTAKTPGRPHSAETVCKEVLKRVTSSK